LAGHEPPQNFNPDYPEPQVYRDWFAMVSQKSVPVSPEFKLETLLTSDVEVAAWNGYGLPSDELSVQNGTAKFFLLAK
jgi:dynein heavy chain, axonemal